MNPDLAEKRASALAFLTAKETGVLATCSEDGTPHARTLYFAADDTFAIYFLTLANTKKVAELTATKKAAFLVSDADVPRSLEIEGAVADITETAELDDRVRHLLSLFGARGDHFAPLTHLDPAAVRYFRLAPDYVRWADFTAGNRSADVLTELPAQA